MLEDIEELIETLDREIEELADETLRADLQGRLKRAIMLAPGSPEYQESFSALIEALEGATPIEY